MAGVGSTSDSSSDNETDDDEKHSIIEPTQSTADERTDTCQPTTVVEFNGIENERIDLLTVRRSNNYALSTRTCDIQFRIPPGDARSLSIDAGLAMYQGPRGHFHVMSPIIDMPVWDMIHLFSISIEINLPLPQESVGVEDTQPHDMPAIITRINILPRSDAVNDENSHHNVSEITPDNRDEMIIRLVPIEANIPMIEVGSTTAGAPAELSHDYDHAVDTNETQSDITNDDERTLLSDSFLYVDDENEAEDVDELTRSGHHRGESLPNPTMDDKKNVNDEQSMAAALPNDESSCPITVNERDANVSTEGETKMILAEANPPVVDETKLPIPGNSSDQSSEEVNVDF